MTIDAQSCIHHPYWVVAMEELIRATIATDSFLERSAKPRMAKGVHSVLRKMLGVSLSLMSAT